MLEENNPKILIIIGDAGAGHMVCANAMKREFLKLQSNLNIKIVNLFALSPITINFDKTFSAISKYKAFEEIYNLFYRVMNSSNLVTNLFKTYLYISLDKQSLSKFQQERPDIVITNNALTTSILSKIKKKLNNFYYVVTIPDLSSMSRLFADRNADIIYAPIIEMVSILRKYKVNEKKIKVGYYPLRNIETSKLENLSVTKKNIFKKYKLDDKMPLILLTGGGVGTQGIIKGISDLLKEDRQQFLILTGKDKKLFEDLENKYGKLRNIKIVSYTDNIIDLFAISDLVITKPGPGTLFELEKLNKKAIFTKPMGYQEFGNVEYLIKNPNFKYIGTNYKSLRTIIPSMLKKENVSYKNNLLLSDKLCLDILTSYKKSL